MKAQRIVSLTAFSPRDPEKVDRTVVRWDPKQITLLLENLWTERGGISMKYTVYTHRMIQTLRRSFDRRGYTLRAQTELKSGTVVVWVGVKFRGNRPRRQA